MRGVQTRNTMNEGKARVWLQVLLVLVVLGAGGAAAWLLILAAEDPAIEERVELGPLVSTHTVEATDVTIEVSGYGTVQPKIRVDLVPEVAGKVVEIHPSLVDGGFFRRDETLVQIDRTDYDLMLDRALAAVARAQVGLDMERAEAAVARAEWASIHPGEAPPSPLVLRVPQIQQAEAELQAAKAEVEDARVKLARTRLSLPFNGRILTEEVDVGQYISPGKSIATAFGTDVMEVRVPLEDRELQWLELPDPAQQPAPGNGGAKGVPARVVAEFAGEEREWQGRAVRTVGRVDPRSRMVTVVVEVEQPPLSIADRPSLVPGMFVEAFLRGETLKEVLPVPRHALREGRVLWVADEGRLRIVPVTEILRMEREILYLAGDVESGDRVVITPLDAVTDGMRIRTKEENTLTGGSR